MWPSVRCRCVAGLGVDDEPRAAGLDVPLGHHVRGEHHQVRFERHGDPIADRCDDVRPERQVRHELPVHHVPLDEVDARLLERDDFVAEPREVGGQHGRDDHDRQGHRPRRYRLGSRSVIFRPIVTMRPVATLELRPDRFAAGGEAIAKDPDGRVVFVRGALPGEVVVAEITHEKRDWARAQRRRARRGVARPRRATVRVAASRAVAGAGGSTSPTTASAGPRSPSSTTPFAASVASSDADVALGPSVDPFGYRTTIRVAATADGRAGFHGEQSHDVVAAPECLIAHPVLQPIVAGLRLDAGCRADAALLRRDRRDRGPLGPITR